MSYRERTKVYHDTILALAAKNGLNYKLGCNLFVPVGYYGPFKTNAQIEHYVSKNPNGISANSYLQTPEFIKLNNLKGSDYTQLREYFHYNHEQWETGRSYVYYITLNDLINFYVMADH